MKIISEIENPFGKLILIKKGKIEDNCEKMKIIVSEL